MNKNVVNLYTSVRILAKGVCLPMNKNEIYTANVTCRSVHHDIRGVTYHVNEWGDASNPLLVLLHGWGDCGSTFQFLVDALLEQRYIIAPDWRGFGKSNSRAESYWFPDYVADLDVLLEHYQPGKPVTLLGHSMGGNVARLYAGIMPERVAALINVEGFGLQENDPLHVPAHFRHWIEKSRFVSAYKSYSGFDELARRIAQRNPALSTDKAMFVARAWAQENVDGDIVLRADPAHKLPNAIQYRRSEAGACWDKITAAQLQVVGEDTSFKAAAEEWLQASADEPAGSAPATVVIPGAGHMLHIEQPERLAAAVDAFLRRQSKAVV